MTPSSDDWFRSDCWDASAQELFEAKLKRSRSSRPHYLYCKGLALAGAGDRERVDAGRRLLQRAIDEHGGEELTVSGARYAPGDSYARDGLQDDAERSLRECLTMEEAARPAGRDFSHGTELRLAEVLIDKAEPAAFEEAWRLINAAAANRGLLFNSQIWRAEVARARALAGVGDTAAAAEQARTALALLDRTEPQLPRHPTVGLIQADEATVSELKGLAAECV